MKKMTIGEKIKKLRVNNRMTQAELASKSGISQQMISKLEGNKADSTSEILALADALGIDPTYFKSGTNVDYSPVGGIARHQTNQETQTPVPVKIHGMVPLISKVQAGEWMEAADVFQTGDAEQWLPCPAPHSKNTFALRVQGISMEPRYHDGDIVFVDPDIPAVHGKNVVVRLHATDEVTLKSLVIEGSKMYLKALNPDWPGAKFIDITGDATICGVVIGKWVSE